MRTKPLLIAILMPLAFALPVAAQDVPPDVDITSAEHGSNDQTVDVTVDVVVPEGETATMHFVLLDGQGNKKSTSSTEPASTGDDQEFGVLFDVKVEDGWSIKAVLTPSESGTDTDTEPIE